MMGFTRICMQLQRNLASHLLPRAGSMDDPVHQVSEWALLTASFATSYTIANLFGHYLVPCGQVINDEWFSCVPLPLGWCSSPCLLNLPWLSTVLLSEFGTSWRTRILRRRPPSSGGVRKIIQNGPSIVKACWGGPIHQRTPFRHKKNHCYYSYFGTKKMSDF